MAFDCSFNMKNTIKTAYIKSLPDDEHVIETCKEAENRKCAFCWLTLHNLSQCTVQKKKNINFELQHCVRRAQNRLLVSGALIYKRVNLDGWAKFL